MAGGRPTKYNDNMLKRTKDYLNNYKDEGDLVPSVAGLSSLLGIGRNTIYDWAKHEDKAEFSNILDKIQAKQEQILLNGGLSGDFNASIAKLMLGKHGYSEKVDQALSGPGGGAIQTDSKWQVEFVNASPQD